HSPRHPGAVRNGLRLTATVTRPLPGLTQCLMSCYIPAPGNARGNPPSLPPYERDISPPPTHSRACRSSTALARYSLPALQNASRLALPGRQSSLQRAVASRASEKRTPGEGERSGAEWGNGGMGEWGHWFAAPILPFPHSPIPLPISTPRSTTLSERR